MHAYTHAYVHTYIHECMHACIHAYIQRDRDRPTDGRDVRAYAHARVDHAFTDAHAQNMWCDLINRDDAEQLKWVLEPEQLSALHLVVSVRSRWDRGGLPAKAAVLSHTHIGICPRQLETS